MIAVALARELRDAGLVWMPAPLDLFALPEREMDEDVFVVSDQAAFLQLYNGYPVVAFHGATEWALDYILLNEVVWLPSESQLRAQLEQRIPADAPLVMSRAAEGYRCDVDNETWNASTVEDALGQALLKLLQEDKRPIDDR